MEKSRTKLLKAVEEAKQAKEKPSVRITSLDLSLKAERDCIARF